MKNLRKITRKYYLRQIIACWLVFYMLFGIPVQVAMASPSPIPTALPGGILPGTSPGVIAPISGLTMNVNSLPGQTVINWANFDIGLLATVNFNQGGGWVLNQVYPAFSDGLATGIWGQLNALNCGVIVTNPQGIVFGPSALVNAQSFIASGLRMNQALYESGHFEFDSALAPGFPGATVVLPGAQINAEQLGALVGKTVLNMGTVRAGPDGYVVMAAADNVVIGNIGSDVFVTPTISTDPSNRVLDNGGGLGTGPGTIDAPDAKVILAAGDIFSTAIEGVQSLSATAERDITLTGAVAATGDITLIADSDGSGGASGGTMWAQSTLTSTSGSIDISASDDTINLDADVTAAVDLFLNNNTDAAAGITLKAGQNVDIATGKILTAEGSLAIEATAGEIMAETSIIDMDADGSMLTLRQNDSMDLEQDFVVDNRENTDLLADSTGGSVTSDAAGEWQSIGGHAAENITLSDISKIITARRLETDNGDITIDSQQGKVYIGGFINAGQDVKITATDESSYGEFPFNAIDDAILLIGEYPEIVAGRDILLNNNTWAAQETELTAGQDVRVGWDETHLEYAPKTLTVDGKLYIEADRDITLGGAVVTGGYLVLKADADTVDGDIDAEAGGNMTAYGTITSNYGSIDIYSSDGTTYLYNNVSADDDLTLHNNTVVAADNRQLSAGGDLTLANGKTLEAISGLWLEADNDLTLGGPVTASVESLGNLHLHADGDADGYGNMWAKDTVTNDGSWTHITGRTIDLDGAVSAGNYLEIVASEQGTGGVTGNVTALSTLTAGGNIDITADDHIYLHNVADAGSNITLVADEDGGFAGSVDTHGLVADGYIDISASDLTINLHQSADVAATVDVDAGGDIILRNNTVADDGVVLAAGDDIYAGGDDSLPVGTFPAGFDDVSITGLGDLTLLSGTSGNGNGNILLGGEVTTTGELTMIAGVTGGWNESNVKVNGPVTTGLLTVMAGGDIEFYSDVQASDHIVLSAYDDVQTFNGSSITMTKPGTSIFINAGDNGDIIGPGERNVEITGNVDSAGGITIHADDNVDIDGYVESGTGYINITADDGDGDLMGDIDIGGYVDSGAQIYMHAGDNITLNDWVRSAGDMLLVANWNADGTGTVWAKSWLESTGGSIDIFASDDTIILDDDVTAFTNIELNNDTVAADGITLDAGDDVIVADGKTLDGEGDLDMVAGDNITLGGPVTTAGDLTMVADDAGAGGEILAKSSITTTGTNGNGDLYAEAENIQIDGAVDTAGNIEMIADDSITLGDTVTAAGDIGLYADDDDDPAKTGLMWAKSSITTTSSDLYVEGENIQIDGAVDIAGDVDMIADDSITLGDTVTAAGGVGLTADDDDDPDKTGLMWAKSSITTGSSLYVSGENVQIDGTVDSGSDIFVTADDSITLGDSVTAAGDVYLTADDDDDPDKTGLMWAKSSITTTSSDLYVEGENIQIDGAVDSSGIVDMDADTDIWLQGPVTSSSLMLLDAGNNIQADQKLTSGSNLTALAGNNIDLVGGAESLWPMLLDAGNNITANKLIKSIGCMLTALAGNNIELGEGAQSNCNMLLDAGGSVYAYGPLTSTAASIDIYSSDSTTYLYDDVTAGMDIALHNNTWAADAITLDAGQDMFLADGKILTGEGDLTITAGDDIMLGVDPEFPWITSPGDVTVGGSLTLDADTDEYDGKVYAAGDISANGGDLEITGANIKIKGDVYANGNIGMNADENGQLRLDLGNVSVNGDIESTGDVEIVADDHITLGTWFGNGNVDADGYVRLIAHNDGDETFGDVKVHGDIDAGGFVEIDALDDTIHLWGDIYADDYIWLMANTEFEGWFDQSLDAGTWIQADGYLEKLNFSWCRGEWSDGSLYLQAEGDISLADYVTAAIPADCPECPGHGGGVSIISNNGTIFTPDEFGDPTDTLNVAITGRSVDAALLEGEEGIGVDLPFGPGKAAIVIMSGEDLKLGPDAVLTAGGMYDTTGAVDDRVGVGFLDAPATIGGVPRDEGDPFDAAIYVASKGDIDVSSPVSIMSAEWVEEPEGYWECDPKGAMIVDARDTVTFDGGIPGGLFETSLAAGQVGSRLEVVSRITEWLFQAIGRLPYASGGGPFPTGYDYVLRGAGLDNPGITDGRAWVLENPIEPAPLYRETGQTAEEQDFAEGGCPALMQWLAAELGVSEDTQIFVDNAFAYSTDIQPCDMCARLRNSATILADAEGTGIGALAAVVNEFAAAPAPISEEQMTLIAASFAEHVGDGTYYATATDYIDALVAYVTILDTELGWDTTESVAFAMDKYGSPITESGNENLIAYVEARLAAIGG